MPIEVGNMHNSTTVIAQRQSKRTGQWFRVRRLRESHYVTELLHGGGAWWDVPAGAASNRQDAIANMRRLARSVADASEADADEIVGFAVARPPSH
jgi:hypothetical protein